MKNYRIVFATKTTHSKKIAQAIGKALSIKAENVRDNPVLTGVDLLFIVGGIYGGESLPSLLTFVKGLDGEKVKSAVLVTSCASKKQGQASIRKILAEKNIEIIDEIICQGSFLLIKFGHPNHTDLQEAVDSALQIVKRVGSLDE